MGEAKGRKNENPIYIIDLYLSSSILLLDIDFFILSLVQICVPRSITLGMGRVRSPADLFATDRTKNCTKLTSDGWDFVWFSCALPVCARIDVF